MKTEKKGRNIKVKSSQMGKPITVLFTFGTVFALAFLYLSGFPLIISVGIALLVLLISGHVIARANYLQGGYGFYVYGGKKGIGLIDKLSRYDSNMWRGFAAWGLVTSFGLISYFVFKEKISKRILAIGIISNLIILNLMLPFIIYSSIGLIKLPGLDLSGIQITNYTLQLFSTPLSYQTIGLNLLIIISGFSSLILLLVFVFIGQLSYNIITILLSKNPNYSAVAQQIPGAVPLLPGLTIPLLPGLVALALLLIVHEFSHGVLARISKLKIKRVGLAFFGIVPIGAFVEPEEKDLAKRPKGEQDDIFIAGISANMLMSILFFIPLVWAASLFTTSIIVRSTVPNSPASVIPVNSTILKFNNYPIQNISSFAVAAKNDTPYSKVTVLTNSGYYALKANSTGKIGILIDQITKPKGGIANQWIITFLFQFFALSTLLNFAVGTFNLLPVPGFDGWRIYQNRLKNSKVLRLLSTITIAALVIILIQLLVFLFY